MNRWERLAGWLKQEGLDAAFVHSSHNVFYFTGFWCEPHERLLGLFVFPEGEPFLVCPLMEVEAARQSGWKHAVIGYDDVQNPWELILEEWKRRGHSGEPTLAVEKERLSYLRAEQLTEALGVRRLAGVDEVVRGMRLLKEEDEIRSMKEAAALADEAVRIGTEALRPGVTEMEVVAEIELAMKKRGVRRMSFATMVLFGEKTALPHGVPGLRRLEKGDLVLFDLGVVVDGYCSDITRTVAFGSIDEKRRSIYETVRKAQEAALEACSPGRTLGELDRIARGVIREAGYGEFFPHRLGHGLGIDVHEYPSVNETNEEPLLPGMTFTVEPGIYVPGVGGVRIEDDVLVTEDGAVSLTRFSKELLVL